MKTILSVIIIHWNTPEDLKMLSAKLKVQKNLEVIVIDNNSETSNIQKIKDLKLNESGYKMVFNKSNHGFATASNQGAKLAKGEWLLFLNPDIQISSKTCLDWIAHCQKEKWDASSLEPASTAYKQPLPSWYSLITEYSPLRRILPPDLGSKVFTLTGGCLLIKSSVLKKIGGWDERFFLWFEDSDLTFRLVKSRYAIGWAQFPFKHIGGTSFKRLPEKKKREMFFHSMNLYANKNLNFVTKFIVRLLTILNTR